MDISLEKIQGIARLEVNFRPYFKGEQEGDKEIPPKRWVFRGNLYLK